MAKATPIALSDAFQQITYLEGRTPETPDDASKGSFKKLSDYRNGGIFITHYSGHSEWERHPNGDELVQVLEGETTLILLISGHPVSNTLRENSLLVVPKGIWHRFETPKGAKIMTVTPQPTEHSIEQPTDHMTL